MLEKLKGSVESLRHFCDGKSRTYLAQRPPVLLHDVQASLLVGSELVHIKFCPYCGVEVDAEPRPW